MTPDMALPVTTRGRSPPRTRCRIITSGVPFATDVSSAPDRVPSTATAITGYCRCDALDGSGGRGSAAQAAVGCPNSTGDSYEALEFQVRDARLTDIDRVTGLIERSDPRWRSVELSVAADLLRQFIYMPSAAVLIAVEGRQVLGLAVLSLRPSVASRGLVGSIDMIAVEPGHELAQVADALLRELVRSARNKGCVALEGELPVEPADQGRWEKLGFRESGRRLILPLAGVPASPR